VDRTVEDIELNTDTMEMTGEFLGTGKGRITLKWNVIVKRDLPPPPPKIVKENPIDMLDGLK